MQLTHVLGLGVLLALVGQAGATERHVPSQYGTIQAAIDACADGDAVVLADGVYMGVGNRDLDYAGRLIMVRSASGDPTTCIIDCQQAGRGFFIHGFSFGPGVSGLTIRNGQPLMAAPGGGAGGAIYVDGCATIDNCIITGNTGAHYGGGLCCWGAVIVTGCTIVGNAVEAVYPVTGLGGGVFLSGGAQQCVLRNSTIVGNSADCGGGVASFDGGCIESCIIRENNAFYKGGGVFNVWDLYNSEITRNYSGWYGGGVCAENKPWEVRSCTIADNTAGWYGGGLYGTGAQNNPLANTVLSGNWATYGRQVALEYFATTTVEYSDIAGEPAVFVSSGAFLVYGDGIVTDDPRFVDRTSGDYRLRMDSPCLDAGSNAELPLIDADGDGAWDDPIPWDCSGSMRVARRTADIGAYEIPYADLNCDKAVNAFDIDPFVLALTDSPGYAAAFPDCNQLLADTNGDGLVNAFDIDPFVELLTGGCLVR